VTSEDVLADRLGEAVLWARDQPELLERHGLPVPTPRHTKRVLEGYVGRWTDFGSPAQGAAPLGTLLGLDRIVSEGARFRFAEHGELGEIVVIQPVSETGRLWDRELVDLVAWHPARPRRWWLLDGLAEHLGPWPEDGEARLVETPLAWVRDPEALCVLNFGRLGRLLELSRIVVPDRDFGIRVYDALRELALPNIEVAA
jgi:hypothetical protein